MFPLLCHRALLQPSPAPLTLSVRRLPPHNPILESGHSLLLESRHSLFLDSRHSLVLESRHSLVLETRHSLFLESRHSLVLESRHSLRHQLITNAVGRGVGGVPPEILGGYQCSDQK